MKKSFMLILSNLFVLFACNGQINFSKLYYQNDDEFTTWGYSLDQSDNYYYIYGGGGTNIGDFQYISCFLLMTDSLGNQLEFRNFASENSAWYASNPGTLKKISDEKFIAASAYADTNGTYGIVYIFDNNCDTLFTKKFIGDGYTAFWNTDFRSDTIYLIGATRDTILYNTYMYMIAIDTSGNTLWERKYGDGIHDELGFTVDHFENGNLVIGGFYEFIPGGLHSDGKIYKTDTKGNSYFSQQYGTPGDEGSIDADVSSDNQSIIVQQAMDTIINEGDYQFVRYIGKIDTNGNYLWRTFFNREEFLDFWTAHENPDGTIVGCGVAIVDSHEYFHGYITKLTADGEILWERNYTTDSLHDAYFFDVQQTWDKGYIVSGSSVGDIDGDPNQQMWLVKLDSMGCLEPGCADTGTSIIPFQTQTSVFTIYPNPISNIATVEIHIPSDFNIIAGEKLELNIYDINGRMVDHYANIPVNNPNEIIRFNIYKKQLATGIYSANLVYGGRDLGVVKIVAQ